MPKNYHYMVVIFYLLMYKCSNSVFILYYNYVYSAAASMYRLPMFFLIILLWLWSLLVTVIYQIKKQKGNELLKMKKALFLLLNELFLRYNYIHISTKKCCKLFLNCYTFVFYLPCEIKYSINICLKIIRIFMPSHTYMCN